MTSTVASTTRRTPTTSTPSTTSTTSTTAPPAPQTNGADDAESLPSTSTPTAAGGKRATPEQVASATTAATALTSSSSTEEADEATLKLLQLPNADFAAAMKSIAAEPDKLERLLSKSSSKEFLIKRLVSSGVLHTQPASIEPKPAKGPTPPPAPTLLKDDPSLPQSLRDLALRENLAKIPAYEKQHTAYVEQYKAAVDGAKSVAELRAMGPLRGSSLPELMPSTSGHIDERVNAAWQHERGVNMHNLDVDTKVADKTRELTGRPIAGLSLTGSLKGSVTVAGHSASAEVSVSRGADGKTGLGGGVNVGGVGYVVDAEGKRSATLEREGIKASAGDGGVDAQVTSAGPDGTEVVAGVKGSTSGAEVRLEIAGTGGAVGFDKDKGVIAEGKVGGFGGKTAIGKNSASYAIVAGAKHEGKLGSASVEAELGMGIQGLTEADTDAFVATNNVGFYDTPPELKTKSWAQLPADLKATYEQQMWTEKEWNAARSLTLVR